MSIQKWLNDDLTTLKNVGYKNWRSIDSVLDDATNYIYKHGDGRLLDSIIKQVGLTHLHTVKYNVDKNPKHFTKAERSFISYYHYNVIDTRKGIHAPKITDARKIIKGYLNHLN